MFIKYTFRYSLFVDNENKILIYFTTKTQKRRLILKRAQSKY